MMQKFIRLLKNPRTQQLLLSVGPIIVSWVANRAKKTSSTKAIKSKRV